ncbi:MAG: hypothetical protein IPN39_13440 [Chitinophagaceae bacterium]|nr:hypothetical protein [Chitinophagaceae bacterium]MBP9097564.1 hypothetical protein [Ferruginibacter sp.]
MKASIKITGFVLLVLSFVFSATVQAQASKELNDQFLKILESFPSGFETLKNGVPKYDIKNNSFYSKVNISGTKYCFLEKDYRTGKLEYLANIESDEELPMSVFDKLYTEWKAKIASLDFNGVPLVPYTNTKYKNGGEYEMYVKGDAWRLKTEGLSIDKKYFNFTIRLEYLDLDQGGLMVRILITDN